MVRYVAQCQRFQVRGVRNCTYFVEDTLLAVAYGNPIAWFRKRQKLLEQVQKPGGRICFFLSEQNHATEIEI